MKMESIGDETHREEKPNICSVCFKIFNNKELLENHKLSDHEKQVLVCQVCYEIFNNEDELRSHSLSPCVVSLNVKHEPKIESVTDDNADEVLNQKAGVCVERTIIKTEIKTENNEHSHEVKTKGKNWCPICSKTFTTPKGLRKHNLIHTGEKPYQCTVCGKSFRQTGGLTSHMRTHTGAKPYECVFCGQSFVTSSSLNRHKLRHSG